MPARLTPIRRRPCGPRKSGSPGRGGRSRRRHLPLPPGAQPHVPDSRRLAPWAMILRPYGRQQRPSAPSPGGFRVPHAVAGLELNLTKPRATIQSLCRLRVLPPVLLLWRSAGRGGSGRRASAARHRSPRWATGRPTKSSTWRASAQATGAGRPPRRRLDREYRGAGGRRRPARRAGFQDVAEGQPVSRFPQDARQGGQERRRLRDCHPGPQSRLRGVA